MSMIHQAMLLDSTTDLNAPLLACEESQGNCAGERIPVIQPQFDVFARFRSSSLILGLIVGFFIQFATLGANFLAISFWGEDVATKSKFDVIVFSLLWSLLTSALAIFILGLLRALVTVSFQTAASTLQKQHEQQPGLQLEHDIISRKSLQRGAAVDTTTRDVNDYYDGYLDNLTLHLECRFVIGALVGVCLAWTLTDFLLGMQAQIIYSLVTLAVALCWCRAMVLCFATKEKVKQRNARKGRKKYDLDAHEFHVNSSSQTRCLLQLFDKARESKHFR